MPQIVVSPRGTSTTGDSNDARWHYSYDELGNVVQVVDPRADNSGVPENGDIPDADDVPESGPPITAERDGDPYTTQLSYDAFDRLKREVVPKCSDPSNGCGDVGGTAFITRTYDYDANDNMTERVDGAGEAWTSDYSTMDRLASELTPVGQRSRYCYDAEEGLVRSVSPRGSARGVSCSASARGNATTFELDPVGRRVAEIRESSTSTDDDLITAYAFDDRDNVVGVSLPKNNTSGGDTVAPGAAVDRAATEATQRYAMSYDRADQLLATVENPALNATSPERAETQFRYDANGNLTREIGPRAFEGGAIDPADFTTVHEYDGLDRETDVVDPEGNRTSMEYDAASRLIAQVRPNGNETSKDGDYTTRYSYDPEGQLIGRSMPWREGQYGWSDGELKAAQMTMRRDEVGNPISVTDGAGNLAKYRAEELEQYVGANEGRLDDHTFRNTFYDTGDLKTTTRPSLYSWSGPGSPISMSEGGSANAGSGGGALPQSQGIGDLGAVGPAEAPSLLPKAGRATFSYDNEMRLKGVTDSQPATTNIGYDAAGRLESVTTPFKPNDPIEQLSAYDANNNLRSSIDGEGDETTMAYDDFDRMVDEIRPGSRLAAGVAIEPERTHFDYDANGNQVAMVAPKGFSGGATREDFTSETDYDALDRPVEQRRPAGTGGTQSFVYDSAGNQIESISPRYTTETVYDRANRPVEMTEAPDDPQLERTTYIEYDGNGNQIKVDEPGAAVTTTAATELRRVTETVYDGRDLPWKETKFGDVAGEDGGNDSRTTITEYDPLGNLRREIHPRANGSYAVDPGVDFTRGGQGAVDGEAATKNATVYEYSPDDIRTAIHLPWDEEDREADNDDPDTDPELSRYRQDFDLDPVGRVERIVPTRDWTEPGSKNDPEAKPTTYEYYSNGWISKSAENTDPDATPRNRPERPNDAGNRDPDIAAEQTTSYDYDARGYQTSWESVSKLDGETETREVSRTYYPSGQLESRVGSRDGQGATRTHSYFYDPNRSMVRFNDEYDSDPAPEQTTRLCYDNADRVRAVDDTDDSADTLYTYADDDQITSLRSDGEVSGSSTCSSNDPSYTGGRTTGYTYDGLGQETETEISGDGDTRTYESTYHSSGDLKTRAKPNGTVDAYAYDSDGLKSAHDRTTDAGDTESYEYTYDRNANRLTDERGSYTYDARDNLTEWTRPDDYELSGTVTYDVLGDGRIASETDTSTSDGTTTTTTTTNHYAGERIDYSTEVGPNGTATISYGYDPFGNVDLVAVKSSQGGPVQTTSYAYDEFGRRTSSEVKLGSEVQDSQAYRYDGLDRRIESTKQTGGASEPTETSTYAYLGLTEQLSGQHSQSSGTDADPAKDQTYDYSSSGDRLGQKTTGGAPASGDDPAEAGYRAYETDAQGTVIGLEGEDGEVAEGSNYEYDPYGELEFDPTQSDDDPDTPEDETESAEAGLSKEAQDNPFRFQGHYYDSGVDAYDMQARSYLPQAAQFSGEDRYEAAGGDLALQSDPLTQNRYAFAGGNPVSNVEWDGHYACTSTCDGGDRIKRGRGQFKKKGKSAPATTPKQREEIARAGERGETTEETAAGITPDSQVRNTAALREEVANAPYSPGTGLNPVGTAQAANYEQLKSLDKQNDAFTQDVRQNEVSPHGLLAGCGAVPVLGAGCDVVDGAIYAIEGDGVGAGLAFAGVLPVPGSDQASSVGRATRLADGVIDAGSSAGSAERRVIGPAGDAAAQGLSRVDRFRSLQRDGIQVGEQQFGINDHLINSVRKSGRRQIVPEDMIDALHQAPTPGTPGSRVYANPDTGSRFFVNDTNDVVGVAPKAFK